jgi:peptide/nickel transport system substrate-binding protein
MVTLGMLGACAPAPSTGQGPSAQPAVAPSQAPTGPKGTLRIAWAGEPPSLAPKMVAPGGSAFNELALTFNSALTYVDPQGQSHPMLAREIPTLDNGGWVVNTDGTMVTTYRLRENAKWHDGAPIRAQDFAFAYRVYIDPEIPVARRDPERAMSDVRALDAHTVVIDWKEPYYLANGLRYLMLDPMPSHLLEDTYRQDKSDFLAGNHWNSEYIGSGPFRLERWEPGVGITARAFMDWALGPPKAETLEIRFIADGNTIVSALLAGELEVSAHPWVPPVLAASIKDRWVDGGMGYIRVTESRMQQMDFQFREVPDWQPALTDLRVRQALLFALDREGLAELISHGLGSSVANAFVLRTDPLFPEIDRALTKYPHDPSRAAQLLADAGWRRSQADGLVTDASGQTLQLQVRATAGAAGELETGFIHSNWKSAGIDASISLLPRARAADAEAHVSFPGVLTGNRPIYPENFVWTSRQLPTAQNRWLGANRGSFHDSEIDRLHAKMLTATTPQSWRDANVGLHQRMSELLGTAPLYYPTDVILGRNSVAGPYGRSVYPAYSWNIFEWGPAD